MRYLFAVAVIVVAAMLAIFVIGSRSDNDGAGRSTKTPEAAKVIDYASKDSKVTLTAEGPVVGDDRFQAVRISVSRTERVLEVLRGYDRAVERTQRFANNQNAYDTFLRALSTAGYSDTKSSAYADERGVCPLGKRYMYDLESENQRVVHTWSVSCNDVGTFDGEPVLVRRLFENQIPDFMQHIQGVKLEL